MMASYLGRLSPDAAGDSELHNKNTSGGAGSSGLGSRAGFPGSFTMLPLKMDESFGSDLSLAEAVQRLHDLMGENHQLKETLRENNLIMKSLQRVLLDMKAKWESEQTETQKKFEQAKTVVFGLRKDVETKKIHIESLNNQLKQNHSNSPSPELTTNQQVDALYSELEQCKVNLSCMRKERDIHKKEMDNLKIKMEQAQKRAVATHSDLEAQKGIVSELSSDCEQRECQMSLLVQQNKELVKSKKQAELARDELATLNNALKGRLGGLSLSTSDGSVVSAGVGGLPENVETENKMADLSLSEKITCVKRKGYQEDKNLQALLEEERSNVSQLTTEVKQLQAVLEMTRQELHSKSHSLGMLRDAMDGKVREVESLHIQKEGELIKQLDILHRQLQQSVGHQSHGGHSAESIETLRAQVLSLLNEVTESNTKLQQTHMVAETYRHGCEELERRCILAQDELGSLRSKDDQLIDALRSTVSDTERALAKQKEKNEELSSMIEEYRGKLHEVQRDCSTYKYQLEEHKSQTGSMTSSTGSSISITVEQKREQEERLGRLTAQLFTAEDSLLQKQQEIQKLQQKVMLLREESGDIPCLKAQIDSHRSDFEAECRARLVERQRVVALTEELETMRLFTRQLQDQLPSSYHHGNMEHVAPPARQISATRGQNMRSRPYPSGGYDECDTQASSGDIPVVGYRTNDASSSSPQPRTPSEHSDDTETDTLTPNPTLASESAEYRCPKCGLTTQDIDSLMIHVDGCLGESQS